VDTSCVVSVSHLGRTAGDKETHSLTDILTLFLVRLLLYCASGDPYTNQNDTTILSRASRELYYIDEGETLGVVDRNLIIGDVTPGIEDYNIDNPLQEVGVIQSLYPALLPRDIVERVKNCNRPGGSVNDITEEDAEKILKQYKQEFEESWTEGWDDPNDGDVQFVAFFDDSGVIGTTGRLLRDITLDNNKLTAITIILIMVFSAAFLFSSDLIKSKVMVTLVGVVLGKIMPCSFEALIVASSVSHFYLFFSIQLSWHSLQPLAWLFSLVSRYVELSCSN